MLDETSAYEALQSHDPRFDGVFFVGVTSTGIYCRPVCPAKTPLRRNCRFFESASAAEKEHFRPCLRCRPELAPGHAPVDRAQRIAQLVTRRLEENLDETFDTDIERADTGEGDGRDTALERIAAEFEISSRQLRRIVQQELGVSPAALRQTRRLLLAKQLLTETKLPVTEIAFASGFASLRRFNDAFLKQYCMPPSHLRKEVAASSNKDAQLSSGAGSSSTLQLSYRPPYDWEAILRFLRGRMIREVEHVTEHHYARTVRLGTHTGWIRVSHAPQKHALLVEFSNSLAPVLPALLSRLRHLFDLTARPDLIAAQLHQSPMLRKSLARHPGLRVPGAFDSFEMAVRSILGQQITVKAATTLAGRFAGAFGEKIETPIPELTRLTPQASVIARVEVGDIACHGIVSARARSLIALAEAMHSGDLKLEPGMDPDTTTKQLITLPGIGPWTAQYLAMRGLHWPDAFPKEDLAVRKNLGGVTAQQAEALSQPWRPWRAYAVLHVWQGLE